MAAVNHALNTGKMDDNCSGEWTSTGESRSVGARFTVGSIVVLGSYRYGFLRCFISHSIKKVEFNQTVACEHVICKVVLNPGTIGDRGLG